MPSSGLLGIVHIGYTCIKGFLLLLFLSLRSGQFKVCLKNLKNFSFEKFLMFGEIKEMNLYRTVVSSGNKNEHVSPGRESKPMCFINLGFPGVCYNLT